MTKLIGIIALAAFTLGGATAASAAAKHCRGVHEKYTTPATLTARPPVGRTAVTAFAVRATLLNGAERLVTRSAAATDGGKLRAGTLARNS
jgi:hypothetical protein